MAAGMVTAALLGRFFLAVLIGYLALTLAYSIILKSLVLADVIVLAVLYTLRVIGGAMAIDVRISEWLLTFSVFVFSSLALVKRCAELRVMEAEGQTRTHGRDYRVEDLPVLWSLGIATGCTSLLVFAFYVASPVGGGRFAHGQLLWLLIPAFARRTTGHGFTLP